MEESLWSLIGQTLDTAGSIEKAVFYVLMAMSVVSWTLILIKLEELHAARRNGRNFLAVFRKADSFGAVMASEATLGKSPLFSVFKAGLQSLETRRPKGTPSVSPPFEGGERQAHDPRQISPNPTRSPEALLRLDMQRAMALDFGRLQWGFGFLATTGSTSPFIGLFGTVWGIMTTFRALGAAQSASIAVVAPGIASALIATAAGLAVAIPAVMAYNWFLARSESLQDEADGFVEEMIAIIEASRQVGPASVPVLAGRDAIPATTGRDAGPTTVPASAAPVAKAP